ncbi:CocE/NonD family hydrolase [Conexibacter sp. S30A1]|uniref:CocE/NonD family hydrolase n=1 Tax=Conexibacter sp. S30A1 TaxID=2937800 RepID=UPI00200E7D40|nr:CocE/NonD family hydrolase [Conexibacter sp. S30A1]
MSTTARRSSPGHYEGYSERLYDSWQRSSFYVAVRDGTRLAVDLYRPVADGVPSERPHPVLWIHTAYQRSVLGPDGSLQLPASGYMPTLDLTLYGYVLAVVDTRGKGASFGFRRGMQDSTEGRDAYDMTEWFAAQPWCDGNVGMLGCSYLGGSQDNAAITTPPSLKAIFPGATPFNRYDSICRGGLLAQFHTRPEDPRDEGVDSLPVDDDPDGVMLAAARAEHRGNSIMAEIWRDIPFRDDRSKPLGSRFWEECSLSTYRNAVEMHGPVMYRWTGWRDEFTADQFVALANLRNVVKVFIGSDTHCQSPDFDMFAEHLRFFDRYLKGVQNGIDTEDPVYYYTYNAEPGQSWSSSPTWPVPGMRPQRWFLDADRLALAPMHSKRAARRSFEVDYSVITWEPLTPFWPESQHGHGVSFETAPFERDMRLTGHSVVSLWLSSTQPDGDNFAYLEEIEPGGEVHLRAHGRLRSSHRRLGTPPYDYLGLPWHRSFREDYLPLVPGEPEEHVFDLLPTSTIVCRGSRLRLVVTGADPRQRTHLPFDEPPMVTVHTGGRMASYIELPVVPAQGASDAE